MLMPFTICVCVGAGASVALKAPPPPPPCKMQHYATTGQPDGRGKAAGAANFAGMVWPRGNFVSRTEASHEMAWDETMVFPKKMTWKCTAFQHIDGYTTNFTSLPTKCTYLPAFANPNLDGIDAH